MLLCVCSFPFFLLLVCVGTRSGSSCCRPLLLPLLKLQRVLLPWLYCIPLLLLPCLKACCHFWIGLQESSKLMRSLQIMCHLHLHRHQLLMFPSQGAAEPLQMAQHNLGRLLLAVCLRLTLQLLRQLWLLLLLLLLLFLQADLSTWRGAVGQQLLLLLPLLLSMLLESSLQLLLLLML
jgi:hypothetical protein